jgi:hypothetical protein
MLVFYTIEQSRQFSGFADPRMSHYERLEGNRLVGLLQFARKAGDRILSSNIVYFATIEPVEILFINQGSGRSVKWRSLRFVAGPSAIVAISGE